MIKAEKLHIFKKEKFQPGYVSIKRNGIHAIYDPSINEFYTRTPRVIVGLDHLKEQLRPNGPLVYPLVGELILPGVDFETTSGLIRNGLPTPGVVFRVFNIIMPEIPFKDRLTSMQQLGPLFRSSKSLALEPMTYVSTYEELLVYYSKAVYAGEEGVCIINPHHIYQPGKRTWDWMKLIPEISIEVTIVDVVGGTKGKKYENSLGHFVCMLEDKRVFNVGIFKGFTDSWRQQVYDNKQKYVGKEATVEFKTYSKYDIPVQPRFKGIRRD
jgi:hypothetical protein